MSTALSLPAERIRSELGAAQRSVARTEELADRLTEGTPAIFFDSRQYRAPLGHLAILLRELPELLQPVRPRERDAPAGIADEVSG